MRIANIAALAVSCFLAGTSFQDKAKLPSGTVFDDVQYRVNCTDMHTIRITDQEYYERMEAMELSASEAIAIADAYLREQQKMEFIECVSVQAVLEGVPHFMLEYYTMHNNKKTQEPKHRRWRIQVGSKGKLVKTSIISYRLPGTVTSTPMEEMSNGMLTNDLVVGDGEMVRPGSTVRIDYVLSLLDGALITNTHAENKSRVFRIESPEFPGLADGLMGMRVNGKRKMVIPPALGFGEAGVKDLIPPNSTLVVDLVLRAVQ